MEAALEERKAEAAALEKLIAAEDAEIAQLRQKLAELEESSQKDLEAVVAILWLPRWLLAQRAGRA